jgi:hypothetical protein
VGAFGSSFLGLEATFGVCCTADRQEDGLVVLALTSRDVVPNLRTIDETGTIEGLAVLGLRGKVYYGLTTQPCRHLEDKGHGYYVDIRICQGLLIWCAGR